MTRFCNYPEVLENMSLIDVFETADGHEANVAVDDVAIHPDSVLIGAFGSPKQMSIEAYRFPATVEMISVRYQRSYYAVFSDLNPEHRTAGWVARFGPFDIVTKAIGLIQKVMDSGSILTVTQFLGWTGIYDEVDWIALVTPADMATYQQQVTLSTTVFTREKTLGMDMGTVMNALAATAQDNGLFMSHATIDEAYVAFNKAFGWERTRKHFRTLLTEMSEKAAQRREKGFKPEELY